MSDGAAAVAMEPATWEGDLFVSEILRDPYPLYSELREKGPAVYNSRYDVYLIPRYDAVARVLKDHESFTSSAGAGLSDIRKPGNWRPAGPLVETDPPNHTGIRSALNKIMSPVVVRKWRETVLAEGEKVVDAALATGSFDAVRDLAEELVVRVFPQAVGLDLDRDKILKIGDLNFNAIGPQNELFMAALNRMQPLQQWFERAQKREAVISGGWGEQIFEAEDRGDIPPGTASGLMMTIMRGGMDTTISGIGYAIKLLAENPAQLAALQAAPNKAPQAFIEAIRLEAPIQSFFRTTVRDVALDGVMLKAQTKCQVLPGSANRDARRWALPDTYDIDRDTSGHLSFGNGVHNCLGQMIARLEAEAVLRPLAERVESIDIIEKPNLRLVNCLRTLAELKVRVKLKQRRA
jgi:cytochrome P450